MRKETGDWTRFRELPGVTEVDFHWSAKRDKSEPREKSYDEGMNDVYEAAMAALRKAHDDPKLSYVMFTHGLSTSGPGKRSARSVIRGLMRSKEATPYIVRARSIQHESVFVAALKREPAFGIRARKRQGRCYELAFKAVQNDETWTLVHGTVSGRHAIIDPHNKAAERIGHAWLERDGQVYDPVGDKFFSVDAYASEWRAVATKRYTYEEALERAVKMKYWEPFE